MSLTVHTTDMTHRNAREAMNSDPDRWMLAYGLMTIHIGISHITAKNYEDAALRASMIEQITGPLVFGDRPMCVNDWKAVIGTPVSPLINSNRFQSIEPATSTCPPTKSKFFKNSLKAR